MNTSQQKSRAGVKPALIILKALLVIALSANSTAVIAKAKFLKEKNIVLKKKGDLYLSDFLKEDIIKNESLKTFQDSLKITQSDSLKNSQSPDSLANTLIKTESLKTPADTILRIPLFQHGSISVLKDFSFKNINKRDIGFQSYVNTTEILSERLPAYPLDLGNYGGFNHLSFFWWNAARYWCSHQWPKPG